MPETDAIRTERAIVLQALEAEDRLPLAVLLAELSPVDPAEVERALAALEAEGIIRRGGGAVWASPCARRIDALGLVGV
jgi:DNA-binding transcriptional regulator YhcF (GntR family)